MALNIHTDEEFEKRLNWLCKKTQKTKTDLIKELVTERYQLSKNSFQFGAFKKLTPKKISNIAKELKTFDQDHDLD